nr:hypothetical protein [Rhizobium jaguaris]
MTVLRKIRTGIIPAEQYCKGAPWVIKRRDIEDPYLIETVRAAKGPRSSNAEQVSLYFQ